MKARTPRLSVIMPSYQSAALAHSSVLKLRQDLADYRDELEVIVVDDGSNDVDGAALIADGGQLVSLPFNRGKGAAVRAGMQAASGHVRVFTDVDLPFGTDCIRVLEHYIVERGFHVVIGDRHLPGSRYTQELSPLRRMASLAFTALVGRLITGGYFDTQCGLKAFRADVAERLFALSRVDRFAFDVELVYISLKHRLDIKRMAVVLERNDTSSVRVFRDSTRMLMDVARILRHQFQGHYRDDALTQLTLDEAILERERVLLARS